MPCHITPWSQQHFLCFQHWISCLMLCVNENKTCRFDEYSVRSSFLVTWYPNQVLFFIVNSFSFHLWSYIDGMEFHIRYVTIRSFHWRPQNRINIANDNIKFRTNKKQAHSDIILHWKLSCQMSCVSSPIWKWSTYDSAPQCNRKSNKNEMSKFFVRMTMMLIACYMRYLTRITHPHSNRFE